MRSPRFVVNQPGGTYRRAVAARGFVRCGLVRINVQFDPETFGQVGALAKRKGSSFAEAVRLLVEWGLEADDGRP